MNTNNKGNKNNSNKTKRRMKRRGSKDGKRVRVGTIGSPACIRVHIHSREYRWLDIGFWRGGRMRNIPT
ncbi:hypothetical protein M513_11893 [Trichuris suis]|uniref:Uncharacterized protein n=1 Tax=Trichuris suis TaxID=68888 RepID=A0A085LQJ8_9BILA|nr:hypothetical protein M513_11893 [Trichuris suis]